MALCSFLLWSLLLLMMVLLPRPAAAAQVAPFKPPLSYLLNCGAASNTTADGRTWLPDPPGLLSPSTGSVPASASAPARLSSSLAPTPLLQTARIFPSPSAFTYTFPVIAASRYWLRLYFYPFAYQSFDLHSAIFSVTADGFTLLANLRAASSIGSPGGTDFLFKEYSVNATSDVLSVSFIPSDGSVAFINALEVTSMPDDIVLDDSSPLGINSPQALGLSAIALECVHRVNVGGPVVLPSNDSVGLYRTWLPGETFLFSTAGAMNISTDRESIKYPSSIRPYFAPPIVYSTALQMEDSGLAQNAFNLSWVLPVHPEFVYIVRLHFCEIVFNAAGQRIFNIYLQNQTAYPSLDLVLSKQADNAYFRDFTVNSSAGIDSLWIQVGPTPNAAVTKNNAILNGIEVWKLNNSAGSLDGESTVAGLVMRPSSHSNTLPAIIGGGLGTAMVVLALAFVGACFLCRKNAKVYKHSPSTWLPLPMYGGNSTSMGSKTSLGSHKSGTGSYASSAPSGLGKCFSFAEMQEATNYFDESLVLGVGGFGKVYRGDLDDGTPVAVKRGNPGSQQGITEFQTEIEMLSKLRHRHLVSLIGYCEEHCEMILVYEYMGNGPLRMHLYGSDLPSLSWKQRLDICIGAARGLHYLHTGAAQSIIHRDVKTTNILLDDNLVAKVSDFGLSKTGPMLDHTHVSTAVKGSFGYLDPEYFRRQQLTEKSDVYSFGVVLMEVLCARPAINPALPRDQVNIAEWAMHWQKLGMLDHIIDPHLIGSVKRESLKKYGEIAEKCLAEQGVYRPAMGDVLWNLEYALQLQETSITSILDGNSSLNQILELPVRLPVTEQWEVTTVDRYSLNSLASKEDSQEATASAVFSQLLNPQGR